MVFPEGESSRTYPGGHLQDVAAVGACPQLKELLALGVAREGLLGDLRETRLDATETMRKVLDNFVVQQDWTERDVVVLSRVDGET